MTMTETSERDGDQSRPTTVVVIDDHATLAELLAGALAHQPDIDCVGLAGTAEAGIELAARLMPDVVIMDQGLPGLDGVAATSMLIGRLPELRVIMLTAATNPHLVARAAHAGACAFVPKTGGLSELLTAIRSARTGSMVVASSVLAQMIETTAPAGRSAKPMTALTPREREVLELLALGMDAKRVARRLGISMHTCRGHLKSLLLKLDSHSQLEAVVTATRLGLLGISRSA
jgi:DNA-binding NarL/FixJ family response regulator